MDYKIKVMHLDFNRINVVDNFIKSNKLTLTRTPEEILNKIINLNNVFRFEKEVLINYLPYENAKEIYTKEYNLKITNKKLEKSLLITDIKEAVQDFLDYMVFAWGKAIDERGLSASRSIKKLSAWLWLLGRDDLADLIQQNYLYDPYGMPALIKICEALNIEIPAQCYDFIKGNNNG